MAEPNLTVFFDGGCGLCRREIAHYQSLKALQPVSWVDVTDPAQGDDLKAAGLTLESALQRFHVRTAEGEFAIGAAGFLCLWKVLPGYRHLAGLLQRLSLLPLIDPLYGRFADWHYRRRCRAGACEVTPARNVR